MSSDIPLIIGIVLASLLVVGIIVAAILMNVAERKRKKSENAQEGGEERTDAAQAEESAPQLWAVADSPYSSSAEEEQSSGYSAGESVAEQPSEEFTGEEPQTEQQSAEELPAEEEQPAGQPAEEASADEVPDEPAAETPVAEQPSEKIAEEEPQTEQQSADGSADEQPAEQAPDEPAAAEEASVSAAAGAASSDASRGRKNKPVAGAWTVEYKRDGEYIAVLCAKNGELMLSSETYTTEDGARSGIQTIVRNIAESGTFVIYRDKNDNYYFKLKTSGNKLLCVGEIYKSREQCEKAVESVRRLAADAPVSDFVLTSDEYIEYVPSPIRVSKNAAPGKWQIEKTAEGRFRAKLFAGNGQLMLATEEVASAKTASGSIDSVVKNAADGNFVIDRDKFGRYYYKLRNAKKNMICIGETYDSLSSCIKAIETVRRYCSTAAKA